MMIHPLLTFVISHFTALMIYDYLLTFNHEVRIVWGSAPTAVTILLLGMRWAMVLSAVAGLVPGTSQVSSNDRILGNMRSDSPLIVLDVSYCIFLI